MLRTKILASGLVLALSVSGLAEPSRRKAAPKQVSTLDSIYNYVSRNIVPISITAVTAAVAIYFVRGRAGAQAPALAPAAAAINAMRAQRVAHFEAPAPEAAHRAPDAAPQARGSVLSATTSAGMLRKATPTPLVREVTVEQPVRYNQDNLARLQILIEKLQTLRKAALDADEENAALLKKRIAEAQAAILELIQIDVEQTPGDIEKMVAQPFFWQLFAEDGNWLFEGLTSDQFAAALSHLRELGKVDPSLVTLRLAMLEGALLITEDMKHIGYKCRISKLKLLLEMQECEFMKEKILEAVMQLVPKE